MSNDELEALLVETGQRHHEAYIEGDGADPEWASWYAAHLQSHLWDRLGRVLSRSEITYLLIRGDREGRAPWCGGSRSVTLGFVGRS